MHLAMWCCALLLLLTSFTVRKGEGKTKNQEKDSTPEEESQRSHIPRTHRRSESQGRRSSRAERGRYRSVVAVGIGCAIAGAWICLATIVYVVRYIRSKRKAAARGPTDRDVL